MGGDLDLHKTNSTSNGPGYSEKALETEQIEQQTTNKSEVVEKRGILQKTKRHCARWWWVHLIVFCIGFLIVALCLVYVGMPRIAQDGVNDSSLELTDLQFLESEPDRLVITQKAIIHSPSIFTPTLDAFEAKSYLVTNGQYSSDYMLLLPMPRIHALHPKSNASVERAPVVINNLDTVTAYCTAVLNQEEVTSALVGKTDLHVGALPTVNVKYNKTLTYKGLNGLKGFNVTDVKLNASAVNGPNLKGIAFIPNPSYITVAMGNVTLNLATDQEGIVGTAFIEDMTLRPGDNHIPMTATLNQALVLKSMDLATGLVELLIDGNSSVRNGKHLTYYEGALKSNKLKLSMNVKQIIQDSAPAPS